MKILRCFAHAALAVLFVALSAVMSFAGDPPSRVARLKYISGDVSMQPGGVNDWAIATINRPMTTADRLWSDKNSRAELHLGSAAMRMDSETSLTLTNLSDNTVQLELAQGTLNVQVARLYHGEIFEVDTPNTAFTILKSGIYRFDVDSNGDTTLVTVWKGKGVATGEGNAVRLESRHQARFTGGMSLQHATYKAPGFDGFDQWCQVRADRESHAMSVRYVSPDVVGYEDLGEYGSWREIPDYGAVWYPTRVEAGWAPYRDGSWAWIEPWGWTWVDAAPWGFAPFHYGRWVSISGSWAWVPGPLNVRPCYAPALVAWIGSSGAGVGWFPLGYGEPYVPSYRVSRNYFQEINVSNTRITNITYVTNNYYNVENVRITNIHYVNQTRGITVVNNDVLVNSRRIGRDVLVDRDKDWHDHHDQWVTAGPPVEPSRHSVLGLHADRPTAEPPERILNRRVVVNNAPPEHRAPFESKQADWQDHREPNRMPDSRQDHSSRGNGNAQASDRRHDVGPSDHGRADNRDNRDSVISDRRDWPSRVPRPPDRRGDDGTQSTSAGGNNPHSPEREHKPGMDDGQQQRADDGRNSQHDNSNWNRQQPSDPSAGRRVPRPPSRGDDGPSQPTSAGGNNPRQPDREQNPGMRNGEQQRPENARNSQDNNSRWNRQPDNASAGRQVPRPPTFGGDRDRSAPAQQSQEAQRSDAGRGNASPVVQQTDPMRGRHGWPAPERSAEQPSYGNRNTAPPATQTWRDMPRPTQQPQPAEARRENPAPERQMRPAYNDRSAAAPPVQQVNRATPPPQPERSESHAPAPAPRVTETQHSAPPPPASHQDAGKDASANGNRHGGNQFQDRDHGKAQDH